MNLRLLSALAGAVSLSGLALAACTHTIVKTEEVPTDDGGTPTSGDAGATKKKDGGTSSSSSSSSSSSGGSTSSSSSGGSTSSSSSGGSSSGNPPVCPGPTPADPPWKAPPATSTVCSQADIDYFTQQAQVPNQTFAALETAMKARNLACSSCIFTKETDAAWGPIVYVGAAGGAFFNYGACFARAPGGSVACGSALEKAELCLDEVCNIDDCGSQNAVTTCSQQSMASTASCGKYDFLTACGGQTNFQALNTKCGTAIDVVKVMCAGQ